MHSLQWKRKAASAVIAAFAEQQPDFIRMSKSILVTGGAGYVGSHACKALAAAGYRPVVYDNLSRGHAEAVRWGPLVEGDLTDARRLAGGLRSPGATGGSRFGPPCLCGGAGA